MERAELIEEIQAAKPAVPAAPEDERSAQLSVIAAEAQRAATRTEVQDARAQFDAWKSAASNGQEAVPAPDVRIGEATSKDVPDSLKELAEANATRVDGDSLSKFFDGNSAAAPGVPATGDLAQAAVALPRYAHKRSRRRPAVLVSLEEQQAIATMAVSEARRQDVDPVLVLSFIGQESGFYTRAVGPYGELGLMQVKPETAVSLLKKLSKLDPGDAQEVQAQADASKILKELKRAGRKRQDAKIRTLLFDPKTNLWLGVTLLKELNDGLAPLAKKKHVNVRKVLAAAYNAGQPNVAATLRKYRRTPRATKVYEAGLLKKYSAVRRQLRKITRPKKPVESADDQLVLSAGLSAP